MRKENLEFVDNNTAMLKVVKFNNAFYIVLMDKIIGECYRSRNDAVNSKMYNQLVSKMVQILMLSKGDAGNYASDWN